MCIRAISWALNAEIGDQNAKLVLISLADNADAEQHQCWPSAKHIAKRAEISERTVYRSVNYLKSHGFIQCEHRHWPNGGSRSPLYTLLMPPPDRLSYPPDTVMAEGSATAGRTRTVTEPSLRKNGSMNLKEEGFKALPHSPEFVAWKAYFNDRKKLSWVRELNIRELEGRSFDFEAQWPPQ